MEEDHSNESSERSSEQKLRQIAKFRAGMKFARQLSTSTATVNTINLTRTPPSTATTDLKKKRHELDEKPPIVCHTTLWTRLFRRKRRYNRMDPDPDLMTSDDETTKAEPIRPPPVLRKSKVEVGTTVKKVLTNDDWEKFWVERLRTLVDAPHVTDKEIISILDRHRRITLKKKQENAEVAEEEILNDPDLPDCFYWDKRQVADWVDSVGLPAVVKEMLLNSDISGQQLVTIDASTLTKMGLYDLGTIKMVTKAVRNLFGLPPPNGLRAIARIVPFEEFLKLKARPGAMFDSMTFKQFCELEGIDYEAANSKQLVEIPGFCQVRIKPHPSTDIEWIPVGLEQPPKMLSATESDYDYQLSSSGSSSSDDLLEDSPTVEQLAVNALYRNIFIPQILNDIVEGVFTGVYKDENKDPKRDTAQEIFKEHMEASYTRFSIVDPDEKLKFVTVIAEELVEDILRAREILEDIDKFQERLGTEIPETDIESVQDAVSFYVQSILPLVVTAALKEMKTG